MRELGYPAFAFNQINEREEKIIGKKEVYCENEDIDLNDYENSINKLESVMTTNDYAVTMIDLVSKYTDQEIVKAYYLLKQTKKKKKTSIFTKILNLFRRKK